MIAAGRPLERCGARLSEREAPDGWPLRSRGPRCQRVAGHPGPHMECDWQTWHVLADWSDLTEATS